MLEERKKLEIEYYDKKSSKKLEKNEVQDKDFEGFDPFLLSSYRFLKEYLREKCRGKKVLDYGCGNGIHSFWLADFGAEVIGIDLSEKSLQLAERKKLKENKNIIFLKMDCEKLNFPENYFDIVFDGGTFSSLNINKAYEELKRVLKPNGILIGIETLGHNPFANFKRIINKLTGKRTVFAANHIFKIKNYNDAEDYFNKRKIYFFHIISWLVIPFLKFNFFKKIFLFLEKMDEKLTKINFFKKYAFKVVIIFSHPKKNGKKVV